MGRIVKNKTWCRVKPGKMMYTLKGGHIVMPEVKLAADVQRQERFVCEPKPAGARRLVKS